MKNGMKLLFGLAIVGLTFTACSDDDDDDTQPAATNNTGGGGGGNNNTMPTFPNDTLFVQIATDVSGDVQSGQLDATAISYYYNKANDSLYFMTTVVNMAAHSSSPSADFGFKLPNGTDGSKALSNPPGAGNSTMVHKIASIYADENGTAPSTYTYDNTAQFAVNGFAYAEDLDFQAGVSTLQGICSGCVAVYIDVNNNTMKYGMARTNVITDSEMGGNTATIELVSNVGASRGWHDSVADGVTFTITK